MDIILVGCYLFLCDLLQFLFQLEEETDDFEVQCWRPSFKYFFFIFRQDIYLHFETLELWRGFLDFVLIFKGSKF